MFRVLFARLGSPKVPHALALSFNDPRGMCPECEGLARVWVLDMGPGAGSEGGRIVFEGVPAKLVKHGASLTGQHLAKRIA
jgi:excinuclease UvrABC ATPase subunit